MVTKAALLALVCLTSLSSAEPVEGSELGALFRAGSDLQTALRDPRAFTDHAGKQVGVETAGFPEPEFSLVVIEETARSLRKAVENEDLSGELREKTLQAHILVIETRLAKVKHFLQKDQHEKVQHPPSESEDTP